MAHGDILYRLRDIASYWSKIAKFLYHLAPVGISRRYLIHIKLEWLGYHVWRNYDNMLSHLRRIPERVKQTDGQTELLYQYRASVCWRATKTVNKSDSQKIYKVSIASYMRHIRLRRTGNVYDILFFHITFDLLHTVYTRATKLRLSTVQYAAVASPPSAFHCSVIKHATSAWAVLL